MRCSTRFHTPDALARAVTPASPMEARLLDGLVVELEARLLAGLERAFVIEGDPASWHEPTVRARRDVERRRAERDAAWKARLAAEAQAAFDALFVPDPDSASAWAVALGVADPATLSGGPLPTDLLGQLTAAQSALATAEAHRLAIVTALVGLEASASSSAERQKAAEIAIATGTSHATAETLIHRARLLAGPFASFGASLATGQVSFPHCLALMAQTANITDPGVLATIAERALEAAGRLVVSDFRRHLDALIAELDPDATARRETARRGRCVFTRRGTDGMSFLGLTHQTPIINAVYAQILEDGRLLRDARDLGADATASGAHEGDLDPEACRADALVARVLGERHDDGSVTWNPAAQQVITLDVVIDLDTLNGLNDHAALLGGEPVPATVARDMASVARFFRRVIVDPVDGHLLDYGHAQYLPDPVRRFCLARDRGCREPGCTRRAPRFLQLDHAQEFPHGPSSAANCGALCTASHQRKTLGLFDITDSATDGSATITTTWGQTVHIPPRPYLPRPGPPPVAAHDPLDPPPF